MDACPLKGPLPLPGTSAVAGPSCDTWDAILDAVFLVNPVRHFLSVPDSMDVLGFP